MVTDSQRHLHAASRDFLRNTMPRTLSHGININYYHSYCNVRERKKVKKQQIFIYFIIHPHTMFNFFLLY